MVIILLILKTLSLDSVWILLGENSCWSLLALKGLILILWITVYYPAVDSAIPRLIKGSLQMYSESYKRCSFPASETSTVLCNEDFVWPKERHVIFIDLRIETMDMNSFLK